MNEEFELDLPVMIDSAYVAGVKQLDPLRRLDAKAAFSVRGELVRRLAAVVEPLLVQILSERESALNLTGGVEADARKQLAKTFPALQGPPRIR